MKSNRFLRLSMSSASGLFMLIFGLIAILFPDITIKALAIYFALAALLGGLVLIYYGLKFRKTLFNWELKTLEGVLGLTLGIVILSNPTSATTFLMTIVGIWATIIGLVLIISYFFKKSSAIVDLLNFLTGLISVALGMIIIFRPFESMRFVIVLIGIYALIYGIITVFFSWKTISRFTE